MKITVLLTTYNSAQFLRTAILSILNQTYKNYELLIIDDGSTDNTEAIVAELSDKRINYIKIKHTGRSGALNYGIKSAKYDWIALMDADDISHPKRLELQINYLAQHKDVDWISCWYGVFYKDKLKYIFKLPESSEDIVKNLTLTNSVCFAGSVFNRERILEFGGFRGEVYEDYEFLLRVKNNFKFYNIQQILYFQRKHSDSLASSNIYKNGEIIYNIQETYFFKIKDEFKITNEIDVLIISGWREFIYGSKEEARKLWGELKFKIFFKPKEFIGYIITFFPMKQYRVLRKIGFKFLPFYSKFFLRRKRKEFQKIKWNAKYLN